MKKLKLNKNYTALLVVFLIINVICLLYRDGYIHASFYVDINVVVVANCLLFILALLGTYRHTKAVQNPNPQVFVRSIMLMTMVKFFVLAIAAVAYILLAKQNRNVPAIIIGMLLYVIYAVFEVRGAFKLNKK
ncbi:hypothetical protein A9P82_02085 [Arachidicoccus ginsenosidimutans]|uniref:hypothetical protein n=1 Tax=Arachidicoccus sp. BS20 TaxID=1850526 RepID=UPI0007F125FB|nr:hypothetical protein [Arachidicoccus sp. BS20]ANI88204.1 hypothetical protein A9P82_02085 [Arachidicoccus sp. BS20]